MCCTADPFLISGRSSSKYSLLGLQVGNADIGSVLTWLIDIVCHATAGSARFDAQATGQTAHSAKTASSNACIKVTRQNKAGLSTRELTCPASASSSL